MKEELNDWNAGEQSKMRIEDRIVQHEIWLSNVKKEIKKIIDRKKIIEEDKEQQGFV
jgi:hypothetical protein